MYQLCEGGHLIYSHSGNFSGSYCSDCGSKFLPKCCTSFIWTSKKALHTKLSEIEAVDITIRCCARFHQDERGSGVTHGQI